MSMIRWMEILVGGIQIDRLDYRDILMVSIQGMHVGTVAFKTTKT